MSIVTTLRTHPHTLTPCFFHTSPQTRFLTSTGDVYAATINDVIAIKIGRGDWSPNQAKIEAKGGQAWAKACSGHNWACWEVGQR